MKQNLHTHTLLAALLPLLVCFTGCMREEIVSGPTVTGKGVTIDYSFDDLQTRSVAATTAEKKFDDVYFVFYNSATQAYVAYQKTSAPSGNTGQGSFPLPIPQALIPGNTYNTLIVANYDRFKADGKTFEQYITENRSKDYGQMRRDMKSQAINGRGSPHRYRYMVPCWERTEKRASSPHPNPMPWESCPYPCGSAAP